MIVWEHQWRAVDRITHDVLHSELRREDCKFCYPTLMMLKTGWLRGWR